MFTCSRCRRYFCTEDASGYNDGLCVLCAAVDPWEPHEFDGGEAGDYRCVHCGMGASAPRHVTDEIIGGDA